MGGLNGGIKSFKKRVVYLKLFHLESLNKKPNLSSLPSQLTKEDICLHRHSSSVLCSR